MTTTERKNPKVFIDEILGTVRSHCFRAIDENPKIFDSIKLTQFVRCIFEDVYMEIEYQTNKRRDYE